MTGHCALIKQNLFQLFDQVPDLAVPYGMAKLKGKTLVVALSSIIIVLSVLLFSSSMQKGFPKVTLMETCFADNISGATKVGSAWVTKTNVPLNFQGWAGDKVKTTVATRAIIQLVDSENNFVKSWVTEYGVARPDVAGAFSNPALNNSGFNLELGGIPYAGTYKLQIGSVNGGTNQLCQIAIPLIVEN
jgi:hypothetical protein